MPRVAKPLTQHSIRKAIPRPAPFELTDGGCPGLVYRVQPSGVATWYVVIDRKRHRLGSGDLTLGQARFKAGEWKQAGGPPATEQEPEPMPTLRAFADGRYADHFNATHDRGRSHLNNLTSTILGTLAKEPLDKLTPARLDTWVAERLKAGVTKATVRRNVATIKALLATAARWGLVTNTLAGYSAVKGADEKRNRFLTPAEEKRLRAALKKGPSWLLDLVDIGINTGLRLGETLSLKAADIDLQGKRLYVRAGTTKSGREHIVPLNSAALAAIKRRPEEGYLFPGIGKTGHLVNIGKEWRAALKVANLNGFRYHDIRHSFASRLVTGGVDLYTVGKLLSHSDPKLTQRYAHLAPSALVDAVNTLTRHKK